MESPWQFPTDAKLAAWCHQIADQLVSRFGISREEAVGRINRDWRLRDCLGPSVYLAYHESTSYWADEIYFGKESYFWIAPEDRKRLGLGPLVPIPYRTSRKLYLLCLFVAFLALAAAAVVYFHTDEISTVF